MREREREREGGVEKKATTCTLIRRTFICRDYCFTVKLSSFKGSGKTISI